jgi:glycosyltransferase involved in cell wall biosynthesis
LRVAIDAQLAVGTATGIGEYVSGLIAALRDEGVDVAVLAEPRLDPWRFDRRLIWDQFLLARRARAARVDLLHCASGTVPLLTRLPLVVTVHDIAWLRVQRHTCFYARYYFGQFMVERYARAAQIVVDSEFSRRELITVLEDYDPARVRVVYPGVAPEFSQIRRRPDGRTILVVGTVEPRKNLALIVRTLPGLEGARLVSVGPPTAYQLRCEALARGLNVADRVEFRGYVRRAELLELYATCAVVAQPSRYEGFGYAAAQALCAGAPCVVSDQSSLPEIADGDAPVLAVDDAGLWTQALAAALCGEWERRAQEVRPRAARRFAWSASARAMQTVYAQAIAG